LDIRKTARSRMATIHSTPSASPVRTIDWYRPRATSPVAAALRYSASIARVAMSQVRSGESPIPLRERIDSAGSCQTGARSFNDFRPGPSAVGTIIRITPAGRSRRWSRIVKNMLDAS